MRECSRARAPFVTAAKTARTARHRSAAESDILLLLLIDDAKLGAAGLTLIVPRGFVNLRGISSAEITQPHGGALMSVAVAASSAVDERLHLRAVAGGGGAEAVAAAVIPAVPLLLLLLLSPAARFAFPKKSANRILEGDSLIDCEVKGKRRIQNESALSVRGRKCSGSLSYLRTIAS